ncbi:hypothetical protein N7448_006952 [Penicillium atrosanguineum]|nr:hypothetical protein N7448_006952 [Penicillium atrosanguineum]
MSDSRPVKPFGLSQVYVPRGDPTVDIVFVHGLNGHPHDSWTSKPSKTEKGGCFWPVDLLPEILAPLRPRILTYGYNASVAAFTDGASRDSIVSHAETLASNLAANRNLRNCSDRPIIFVCHSLGGLVVKRALIYSRSLSSEKTEHLRSVYVSTFGILFLGTPHNGSDIAKWGLLLHNICTAVLPKKVMEGSSQLVQALRKDNETLQHINSLFADIMGRFHIYLFHETRSTDMRGTREIIVDEASAAPYIEGVERMGIEADHSHMCKFDDENSPGFEVVAEAILRYSRQAPTIIADRWVEEHKTRLLEKKAKAREIYDGRVDDSVGRSMTTSNSPDSSLLTLPLQSITDGGRNSPVSDIDHSGVLTSSQISHRDPPLFVAPPGFHPNATFYGMEKELEVLHSRLFKVRTRADRTMAVLISGVPGSGKTHLARQYVFAQRENYPGGIFWIDAKSRESSYKCFWEIAQAATLIDHKETHDPAYQKTQSYVNAVRNWLQTRHEWLMVFDGVSFDHDDDINEFRPFLPWNKRCSIIYTSVDATLRKKQRLYEPYCLSMPRMRVEDACKLLFKDLGIKNATQEQIHKATELVGYYECLPLAIHAIGHRLNATGKPIERYRVKYQVTDKKLAEPFLGIMNDLYRLHHRQALNLINLLAFLGHHVPVGLINLGKGAMSAENAEILSSAQIGEDPDLDTTLGTLIHYGLIERALDTQTSSVPNLSPQQSSDDMGIDATPTPGIPGLTESIAEISAGGFFSIYPGSSVVDVVKMHSVVQRFCRDELRIKDEEYKDALNKNDPGLYDSWLIVATRFLCRSYEAAKEKMAHYHDCGLVRDYREYETHASSLAELFPKRSAMSSHPSILREAREYLRQLMKSVSSEIDRRSPSSSQETSRNQKSVFDRSSSSSSSFPESSTDEGLSRQSTFNWTDSGSARAESPEQIMVPLRFKLDLFPPHIFGQAGYESEEGYETDGESKQAPRISPALSQMSQATEKPSPKTQSPPAPADETEWNLVDRHSKPRATRERQSLKRTRGIRRLRGTKPATPLVKVSTVHGRGSSSRVLSENGSSSILASAAEKALADVRRYSNGSGKSATDGVNTTTSAPASKENVPTYASVAARRMLEADFPRRPASMHPLRGQESAPGLQVKLSVESLDGQAGYIFASPLAHEVTTHELMTEPLSRSTYSEPGGDFLGQQLLLDLQTAPGSRMESRRSSLAHIYDPVRELSASTPSLVPYHPAQELSASTPTLIPYPPPPLPYDEDISITVPRQRRSRSRPASRPASRSPAVPHPSAIMPGALPLQVTLSDGPIPQVPKRPGPDVLTRNSSGFSHQSWATEPVRYPPRFSPPPSFEQTSAIMRTATPGMAQSQMAQQSMAQLQSLPGATGWNGGSFSDSALQSDALYPPIPPSRPRLGSVDERLREMSLAWTSEVEPAQILQFGGHRVDVRDARQRLHESGRLQAPRHVSTYQLYHPNISGPLIHEGNHIYAPAPPLEYYGGRRPRSGSSPPKPDYDGLGVRFS